MTSSIRDLAQEIAELNRINTLAEEAGSVSAAAENEPDPIGSRASDRTRMFQWLEQAAHWRSDKAAGLLLECEPDSLDDVLSMLLVLQTELDTFTANHVPALESERSEDRRINNAYRRLDAALSTAIVGLVRHGEANSPLLEDFGTEVTRQRLGVANAAEEAKRELAAARKSESQRG